MTLQAIAAGACKHANRSPAAATTGEGGSHLARAPSRSLPPAAHLVLPPPFALFSPVQLVSVIVPVMAVEN
jgi:hypothetical protein